MKRISAILLICCLLGAAVAFSGTDQPAVPQPSPELAVQVEARNPWTHLELNNDPDEFQFAIVSDRTGGHRAGIFSRAVEKLNLLQPEFVLSVGDLIEGGNKTEAQLTAEWREFDSYIDLLKMPFFYVPGNHDHGHEKTAAFWKNKLGRSYYHFLYKNVLFLCLNTDDPPGTTGHLSNEQVKYAKDVLAANRNVRWTIVAMHRPIWTASKIEETGLPEVEKSLADRPYTVFVGHIHHYQKFVRQGRNYYQLATTGGSSKMRGLQYGEFDHVVWVTMKKTGPVLANVLIDAVLPDDLDPQKTDEKGVGGGTKKKTQPVLGKVFFEGTPAAGAYVVFQQVNDTARRPVRAEGVVEPDGSFALSTYTNGDGAPEGEYQVTVAWRKPFIERNGSPGPNLIPERYSKASSSGLKALIKAGTNELTLELKK